MANRDKLLKYPKCLKLPFSESLPWHAKICDLKYCNIFLCIVCENIVSDEGLRTVVLNLFCTADPYNSEIVFTDPLNELLLNKQQVI